MDDKEVSAGYSSFPSGLRRSAPATQSQAAQAPPQLPPRPPMQQRPQAFDSDAPRKSPILSKVAIGLAVISLVLNFYLLFTITGIKGELRGLSDSFESIKSKD
ncbi:hypothetical protein FJZ26_05730, partial [Candidatus Parvarchaeota archaeon]|nr:hypothetical protein [Candidatus Parvarchaeota archaeon]